MKYWLISDTHFNHKKLIEWGRPKDFEQKLEKSLSSVDIKQGDVFIHLGDICIGDDENVHKRLFGGDVITDVHVKTVLVKGNHDNKSNQWYYEHGWDFVCERFDIVFKGKKLVFTHIPTEIKEDEYNIHGHTHGNDHREAEYMKYYTDRHIDISADLMDFKVITLDSLFK